MRVTLLDDYIATCAHNEKLLPVCRHMYKVIEQTVPICHVWHTDNPLQQPLPPIGFDWPDPAFCLYIPRGITPGYHRFCIDVGYEDIESKIWFGRTQWELEGMLVFQEKRRQFDVIPLAREARNRIVVLAELQLHYVYTEDQGWTWSMAETGPVNATFHEVFIRRMDTAGQAEVHAQIDHLGQVMNLCLGTYHRLITNEGKWEIHPAREARVKERGGKIVKIYKPGTVGYKEFKPGEKTNG